MTIVHVHMYVGNIPENAQSIMIIPKLMMMMTESIPIFHSHSN